MDYIHFNLMTEDGLENPDNIGCTNFDQMLASGSESKLTDYGYSTHLIMVAHQAVLHQFGVSGVFADLWHKK